MQRSGILYRILIALVFALVLVAFVIPQDIKDNYELLFLLVAMPLMGFLWIQAYVDAMRGQKCLRILQLS
jgi:hypothetical protein